MPWLMYSGNTLLIRWKIVFLKLKLFMKTSTCLCEIFFCLFVFVYFSTWLPMCFTLVWDTFMQPCHSNQTQTTSISILGSLPQYIPWSAWQLSHYQFSCKVFFFFLLVFMTTYLPFLRSGESDEMLYGKLLYRNWPIDKALPSNAD